MQHWGRIRRWKSLELVQNWSFCNWLFSYRQESRGYFGNSIGNSGFESGSSLTVWMAGEEALGTVLQAVIDILWTRIRGGWSFAASGNECITKHSQEIPTEIEQSDTFWWTYLTNRVRCMRLLSWPRHARVRRTTVCHNSQPRVPIASVA